MSSHPDTKDTTSIIGMAVNTSAVVIGVPVGLFYLGLMNRPIMGKLKRRRTSIKKRARAIER